MLVIRLPCSTSHFINSIHAPAVLEVLSSVPSNAIYIHSMLDLYDGKKKGKRKSVGVWCDERILVVSNGYRKGLSGVDGVVAA